MINNKFKEQLVKNGVLTDDVDCLDVINYEQLSDGACISLKNITKRYGYINVAILGLVSRIKLSYLDIVLLDVDRDGEYFIPLNFIDSVPLCIEGACEKINLMLYGAKFKIENNDRILPKNNMIVKGGKVFSFSNYEDIISTNLTEVSNYSNSLFVQTYSVDNTIGVGRLFDLNGLVFANSLDNFETNLLITNKKVKSAIYVQDSNNSIIYFLYLIDCSVCYKKYDIVSKTFSDECVLFENDIDVKSLLASCIASEKPKFFGIVGDKKVSIFIIKNDSTIDRVFDGKGQRFDIVEYDKKLVVYLYSDNDVTRIVMSYDFGKSGSNILSVLKTDILHNVTSVLEYNNAYIYTSVGGAKGLLSISE